MLWTFVFAIFLQSVILLYSHIFPARLPNCIHRLLCDPFVKMFIVFVIMHQYIASEFSVFTTLLLAVALVGIVDVLAMTKEHFCGKSDAMFCGDRLSTSEETKIHKDIEAILNETEHAIEQTDKFLHLERPDKIGDNIYKLPMVIGFNDQKEKQQDVPYVDPATQDTHFKHGQYFQ